ncbi:MAG TPA: methyltransferase domain-containing protein [Terriglobales bacterium]|nr:methyltransferase domain-containing protein [Terriglobales bacterium]
MPPNNREISRVTRSKAQAKVTYDRLSHWYDQLTGWSEKKAHQLGLKKLAVKEGERVLEIGFATGHCLKAIGESVGSSGKVYGIDISDAMGRIARQRLMEAGLADRADLRCGDATELPFDSNSIDAVFMSFTLELFDTPEIPIVLDECKRVLRQGGRACVVALSRKRKTAMTRAYEWLHKRLPTIVDCRPVFAEQAMEAAGFQISNATDMRHWGFICEIVLAIKP